LPLPPLKYVETPATGLKPVPGVSTFSLLSVFQTRLTPGLRN
jgi:hypothetical protein